MPEELQPLLERIQKDGVEKAENRAREILAGAERRAAEVVREAEERAGQRLKRAEEDAQVFAERGRQALQLAARDVLLSVESAVSATVDRLVVEQTGRALTVEVLKPLIRKVVETYAATGSAELRVSPAEEAEVRAFVQAELARKAQAGDLQIRGDGTVVSGFRLCLRGGAVQHDFTREAIAEALCQIVRPQVAEIVRAAASAGPAPKA